MAGAAQGTSRQRPAAAPPRAPEGRRLPRTGLRLRDRRRVSGPHAGRAGADVPPAPSWRAVGCPRGPSPVDLQVSWERPSGASEDRSARGRRGLRKGRAYHRVPTVPETDRGGRQPTDGIVRRRGNGARQRRGGQHSRGDLEDARGRGRRHGCGHREQHPRASERSAPRDGHPAAVRVLAARQDRGTRLQAGS